MTRRPTPSPTFTASRRRTIAWTSPPQPLTLVVTPPVLRVDGVDTAVTDHPALLTFQPEAIGQTQTGSLRQDSLYAQATLSPFAISVKLGDVSAPVPYESIDDLLWATALVCRDGTTQPVWELATGLTGSTSISQDDGHGSVSFTTQFQDLLDVSQVTAVRVGDVTIRWSDRAPLPPRGRCPGALPCGGNCFFPPAVVYMEHTTTGAGALPARRMEGDAMVPYARRMEYMAFTANVVKGLFGSMTDPNIISFGGGSPARETLPVDTIRQLADEVLRTDGRGVEALQYGPIEGRPGPAGGGGPGAAGPQGRLL